MSADSTTIHTFALPHEEARAPASFEQRLTKAALALLAGGSVTFKLSVRVPASELPPAKRRLYAALRRLPEWLFVPPALAKQEGGFDYWNWALKACKTLDWQLLVMPRNRTYEGEGWDMAIECRPLDPEDATRFRVLESVFGHLIGPEAGEEDSFVYIRESNWRCVREAAERIVSKCSQV